MVNFRSPGGARFKTFFRRKVLYVSFARLRALHRDNERATSEVARHRTDTQVKPAKIGCRRTPAPTSIGTHGSSSIRECRRRCNTFSKPDAPADRPGESPP
jgi:hypothetical protein